MVAVLVLLGVGGLLAFSQDLLLSQSDQPSPIKDEFGEIIPGEVWREANERLAREFPTSDKKDRELVIRIVPYDKEAQHQAMVKIQKDNAEVKRKQLDYESRPKMPEPTAELIAEAHRYLESAFPTVRDDVRAAVIRHVPYEQQRQRAFMQLAAAYQLAIEAGLNDSTSEAVDASAIGARAIDCFNKVHKDFPDSIRFEEFDLPQQWVVTTPELLKAYINYSSLLSGQIFEAKDYGDTSCD